MIGRGEFSRPIIGTARNFYARAVAPDQGGLLTGNDPSQLNTSDPIRLWIIQLGIIVMMTQFLSLALRKMRQPKVIAEVLGGILLGPTAFGSIPGFTQHIFPQESRPYLTLTADIGLCLFLFLVGLEIDAGVIKRNARLSLTVAFAGMAIPFGFGAALSISLYQHFVDPAVKFTNFMLFTGVAYSITAFPVLCRILTELKLLDTTVGIVVLSAGVCNDVVGWILLALSVALVNGGAGLTAFYILLVCVAWTLFLLFPVRMLMLHLARKTRSTENGPTMFYMTLVILLLFGSAFFTDIIGVNAIFGAFLAGLVVPREGGLAIAMVEKLEDMVSVIFLPLYFTISGLATNLRLLNTGLIWGFTIAIIVLSYSGKFGGCTIAARLAGFTWRESVTVGTLMSCKGLVELIVLNVGLSAGILDQQVFSMFVLEALLLTFMTTPVVTLIYPLQYRVRVSDTGQDFANIESAAERGHGKAPSKLLSHSGTDGFNWRTKFTVVLDKFEHLPGMMSLTQLIQPPSPYQTRTTGPQAAIVEVSQSSRPDVTIDALRLIELSDRTSAVMKSSVTDTLIHTDPILAVFRTFGDLNGMSVDSSLAIVAFDDLATCVVEHAKNHHSHLVLVPWMPASLTEAGDTNSAAAGPVTPRSSAGNSSNPFDIFFRAASVVHSQFVRGVFSESQTIDVALYVDRNGQGSGESSRPTSARTTQHLFLPFFGGPDDRLALEFVVQLCTNPCVSATIIRVTKVEPRDLDERMVQKPQKAYSGLDEAQYQFTTATGGIQDTIYGHATTQTRLQSETADQILWDQYSLRKKDSVPDDAGSDLLTSALSRIEFEQLASPQPLHAITQTVSREYEIEAGKRSRLLVVLGRSRRFAVEDHHAELKGLVEEGGNVVNGEMRRTIGDVATALVVCGGKAGIIVLQAAPC